MRLYFLLLLLVIGTAMAQECAPGTLQVHLFYSESCPHCQKEKPILEKIDNSCIAVDVSFHKAGEEKDLWQQMAAEYNTTTRGVPMTFIHEKAFIGFSENNGSLERDPASGAYIGYKNQILLAIQQHVPDACDINSIVNDPQKKGVSPVYIFLLIPLYGLTFFIFRKHLLDNNRKRLWWAGFFAVLIISFFVFMATMPDTDIKSFAESMPFPLFVFIVALADGFNPCAFTVLIILLSLLTYTKQKKDMFIIGLTFVITSAMMYFIFIVVMILIGSWALEQYGPVILLVLGIIITLAGIINLKDFFFFKKGVSLTLSEKQQSSVYSKAGKIVRSLKDAGENRWLFVTAVASTFFLAIFVNLIELGCTAILPTVYMASLVSSYGQELTMAHLLWTGFYSLVYILPLLAILLNFVYTFKSARLTETQGRVLKLISGLFMIFFGMIMIFSPELLMF